jgi:hypothetical protein
MHDDLYEYFEILMGKSGHDSRTINQMNVI